MTLQLDHEVLEKHRQQYQNSCVAMGVEFVLKLLNAMPADSFDLQNEYGDKQKSGSDFHETTINQIKMKMEFNISRGPEFPLNELFEKIKSEIDNGYFVNCAWQPSLHSLFHAFVIYGYTNDEFLAITKYHNDPTTHYITDMKTKLTNIQGSDIITFKNVNHRKSMAKSL